ncbi:MAG TPA: hypothetical protein VHF25_00385 [Nitriliruptorales bacterium]|nr:hypothetical protein [Nitriliruptorales bacterium]
MTVDVEAAIDALFAAPLDEFVERRDALARQLRSQGDRAAAGRVKSLRKPTLAAWAVDQAVRRRPDDTDRLLAAGERVVAAQRRAVSGADADPLRDAVVDLRTLVRTLADEAVAVMWDVGAAAAQHVDEVRTTLQTGAVDEDAREDLRRGRLERPLSPAGFGTLAGLSVVTTEATSEQDEVAAPDRARAEARHRVERLRRQAETFRAAAERLDRRATQAEERARRLADEARVATEDAADRRDEADRAAHELAEVERAIAANEAGLDGG